MQISKRPWAARGADAAAVFEGLEAQISALKVEVAALRDVLNAEGIEAHDIDPSWAHGLTRAQRQLLAALIRVYPRWVQPWELEAVIPTQKAEREHAVNFARVLVSQVRRKKGADVIENRYGAGYRVSPCFIGALRDEAA